MARGRKTAVSHSKSDGVIEIKCVDKSEAAVAKEPVPVPRRSRRLSAGTINTSPSPAHKVGSFTVKSKKKERNEVASDAINNRSRPRAAKATANNTNEVASKKRSTSKALEKTCAHSSERNGKAYSDGTGPRTRTRSIKMQENVSEKKQNAKVAGRTPSKGERNCNATKRKRERALSITNKKNAKSHNLMKENSDKINQDERSKGKIEAEAPSARFQKKRKTQLGTTSARKSGRNALVFGLVSTFFAPQKTRSTSKECIEDDYVPVVEDESVLRSIVAKLPERFAEEKEEMRRNYESKYGLWWGQWQLGYSLLFYGVGSKRNIINDFARKNSKDGACLSVLGADPKVTARNIVARVLALVKPSDKYGQLSSQAMIEELKSCSKKVYVIIHNIDGSGLRDSESQRLLSEMASLPNVFLAATVDHVNAPLLWDVQIRDRFSWLWHAVHTYEPYITEVAVAAVPSMLGTKRETATLESALVVLSSLSSTAQQVFKIIIESQLDEEGDQGIDPQMLFKMCRDRFLVSNQGLLQAILTEYKDHHLLATKKGQDGREILYIPLETPSLRYLVEDSNV